LFQFSIKSSQQKLFTRQAERGLAVEDEEEAAIGLLVASVVVGVEGHDVGVAEGAQHSNVVTPLVLHCTIFC